MNVLYIELVAALSHPPLVHRWVELRCLSSGQ